jgi:hypothetical protein
MFAVVTAFQMVRKTQPKTVPTMPMPALIMSRVMAITLALQANQCLSENSLAAEYRARPVGTQPILRLTECQFQKLLLLANPIEPEFRHVVYEQPLLNDHFHQQPMPLDARPILLLPLA